MFSLQKTGALNLNGYHRIKKKRRGIYGEFPLSETTSEINSFSPTDTDTVGGSE